MKCGDFKGSGQYVGFHDREACRACGGNGVAHAVGVPAVEGDAVMHFGFEEIVKALHPPLVYFDFPSCLGPTAFPNVMKQVGHLDRIYYVYLLNQTGERGNWIRYDEDRSKSGGRGSVVEFFERCPDEMYALYTRVNNQGLFKLIATQ